MSATPWVLIRKHLLAHWLRTILTLAGMVIALFLFCFLISIVSSIEAIATAAASNRVIVQSAVSLFVDLPRDYQPRIAAVEGVEMVEKFQWFGGIYKDPSTGFFAQFGIEPEVFFEQYRRDFQVVSGPNGEQGEDAVEAVKRAMAADRRAALVGQGLIRDYQWKVGETVPLLGTWYAKNDGTAWDFVIVGTYKALTANADDRTMFFRYDYIGEMVDAGLCGGTPGVGTYAVNVAPGHDPARVIAGIDRLFENGPQKTQTVTEAAFNAAFVSMWGNLPVFTGTIGGAVVFAVFFTVVNVMLMSARQRTHEAGILKAVGFSDGAIARLMLGESLALALLGGGAGIGLAYLLAIPMRAVMGAFIPNFTVETATVLWGAGITLLIGLVAGIAPALNLSRLRPTEALRSE